MKRYSVYILGPNGPASDTLVASYWKKSSAVNRKFNTANSHTAVYDNLNTRWIEAVYR